MKLSLKTKIRLTLFKWLFPTEHAIVLEALESNFNRFSRHYK